MARRRATPTSNGRLEEAMANLINNQAVFIGQMGRMNERFARIEAELLEIKAILLHSQILQRHEQILEGLPEAIRQKVGFKSQ